MISQIVLYCISSKIWLTDAIENICAYITMMLQYNETVQNQLSKVISKTFKLFISHIVSLTCYIKCYARRSSYSMEFLFMYFYQCQSCGYLLLFKQFPHPDLINLIVLLPSPWLWGMCQVLVLQIVIFTTWRTLPGKFVDIHTLTIHHQVTLICRQSQSSNGVHYHVTHVCIIR